MKIYSHDCVVKLDLDQVVSASKYPCREIDGFWHIKVCYKNGMYDLLEFENEELAEKEFEKF